MTRRLQGNSYGLAYGILWSTGFPVTHLLLAAWDPYTLAAARIGLAGLLLALAAYLVGQRYLWRTWPWRRAVLIGGIGVGISTVMLTLGVKYSNPVNAAVLSTTLPLVSAVMGITLKEEKISPRLAMGIGMAVLGGVLIVLSAAEQEFGWRGGEAFAMVSVVTWTWFSRASTAKLSTIPPYPRAVITMLSGALVLIPVTVLLNWVGLSEIAWSIEGWNLFWILWLCPIAAGVSLVFWLRSAEYLGVTIAAIHINLVPFYVIVIAFFSGGRLSSYQIIGACLVMAGAVITQVRLGRTPGQLGSTGRR